MAQINQQQQIQQIQQVFNEIFEYGYVLPNNFNLTAPRSQRWKIYDSYNDSFITTTLPSLRRKISREKRPIW